VWKRINSLFNWLPLAALIENKILCMHGGIGRCINKIEQIAELERPITMEVSGVRGQRGWQRGVHAQQRAAMCTACARARVVVAGDLRAAADHAPRAARATRQDGGPVLMDLLWSDPTTNDGVQGVQPSPRGPGLVTFGPDRVKEFCKVRAARATRPARHAALRADMRTAAATHAHAQDACAPPPPLSLCVASPPRCIHARPRPHADEQPADDCARARVRDGWL
jgi:hypothetical protein